MATAKSTADQTGGDPAETPEVGSDPEAGAQSPAGESAVDAPQKSAATRRYKVIQTRVNRIVDGERAQAKFGDVLDLDPDGAEAKRLLGARAVVSLDDDENSQGSEQEPVQRGTLDATPPGPIAGSQGTAIEQDDKGVPLV